MIPLLRFIAEPRSVHPHWWIGSTGVLGLENGTYADAMFGVTPAVLSTFGARVTTASIKDRIVDTDWYMVWLE